MNPFLHKTILIVLLVIPIFILSACGRKKPSWADTLSKQMDQPNSILQVDSGVLHFMVKYKIPGMSIAISKNGKMIYSKGYGFADKSTAKEVNTKTLFRIGRTSELLTSIAIMKLVGDGKLSLESKVFGDSGILGNEYGASPYEKNITNINVNELLHHNFGGWTSADDITWKSKYLDKAVNAGQLISFTLKNIPLRTSPGSAFGFSDFGYLVLGRIVEKISGMSYPDFVKEKILKAPGISDMQIEVRSADERQHNEAVHYRDVIFPIPILVSEEVDDDSYPYSALGDACYGWIASAEDLLKIVVSLDDSIPRFPILSAQGLKTLLSANKTNPNYGCGIVWNNDFTNWYDLGDYRGSTSEIVHAKNGYCWAILINTYRPALDSYFSDMDHIVWDAIDDGKTKWPDKDLF